MLSWKPKIQVRSGSGISGINRLGSVAVGCLNFLKPSLLNAEKSADRMKFRLKMQFIKQ